MPAGTESDRVSFHSESRDSNAAGVRPLAAASPARARLPFPLLPLPPLLFGAVALVLGATTCFPDPALTVTFLDVGQGDAILVQAPGGQTALIDAGRGSATLGQIPSRGVSRINLLVASHPDADHIGGLDEVLESLPAGAWLASGRTADTRAWNDLIEALANRPRMTRLEAAPQVMHLGSATIEVLPPLADAHSDNDASVALAVRYGDFSALLAGDAEIRAINHLLRSGAVPDVTVLKASHHGSDNGVTDSLLAVARPEIVVIQVGRGNAYGLPDAAAVAMYQAAARELYRTNQDGTVTVRGFRDGRYRVAPGR